MGQLQKFGLLLWKNYILQKRHKVQTVVEIVTPVAFAAILVLIRFLVTSETYNEPTTYLPFRPDQFEANTTLYPKEFCKNNSYAQYLTL